MLNINFTDRKPDFDATFTGGDYPPVQEGWYTVVIVDVDDAATKKGDGRYLSMKLEIVDGENKGRYLWARFNYDNPSKAAEKIALDQLTNVAHATGVMSFVDANLPQLLGKMLDVFAYVIPANDKYKAKNEISGYRPCAGAQTQAQTTQGSVKPAWAK